MKAFNTIIVYFSFAAISCSTVKTTEVYGTEMEVVENVRSRVLIEKFNAFDKDKSFLTFMSEFDNFITVENGDSLIFSKKSKTMPMQGFTAACIIFNNRNTTITVDNKQKIKLNKEELPKYKFIYIGKHKNHYKIEYTNRAKSFL